MDAIQATNYFKRNRQIFNTKIRGGKLARDSPDVEFDASRARTHLQQNSDDGESSLQKT